MLWIVEVQEGTGQNVNVISTSDPMPFRDAVQKIGLLRIVFRNPRYSGLSATMRRAAE